MTGAQPRVLILTASYGSGHARAAGILADEFRRAGALPTVVDHFRDLVHPTFDQWSRALYYGILHRAPAVWGGAYWLGDRINVGSPLLLGFNRVGARKLRRMLRAHRFDQVVSVQPTPAGALSYLRSRGETIPPHTTVFTDFVAHTQWIHPHVDRYCVPAEEISHELTARGLPRDSVVVTGIPVAPEFLEQPDRAAARLSLGLSPRLPVLLFMDGSGGGFGRLEEAARAVLAMEQPFQAVLVVGHSRASRARL
jgi:processive 1,2-diacylglycerol beta-glucosyltransferase